MGTRPFVPGQDEDFVFEVYSCSRNEEISAWGLSAGQASDFLRMQHRLQLASYRRGYPDAAWSIVQQSGRPVGYLCVARAAHVTTLVDIALLAHVRRAGLGTALLRALQAQVARDGSQLCLSVRVENPARRLYARLGFVAVAEHELYLELVWSARSIRADHEPACRTTTSA